MKKDVEINLEGNFAKSSVRIDGEIFPVTDVKIEYHVGDIPKVTLTFLTNRIKGMIKEGKLQFLKGVI